MSSQVVWLIVGVVVLLLAVSQWSSVVRIWNALSAQFGKLSKWIWGIDAVAVYQAEVDRAAEEIGSAGEGLEQYRGMVARLERQVNNGEKQEAALIVKIESNLKDGNEARAREFAVQLSRVQSELAENRSQLKTHEETYQNNLKKVKFANERIRQAKEKAEKMQADLRLSKAEAETAKLAKQFNVKTSALDGLLQVEEEIQRQIETNRAKSHVIRDLSQDGLDQIQEDEKAQNAEADLLLEKFKAKMK
jgi:phage shock protein A